ncbi:MAG: TIGR03936 family radical SAM-associated protein [Propionibacteriaceae bacterium]|jgi:radical SAM-linked protein|nr:TIGR03936 family radical SAM-associated protein [Propionibacteriaceae bacterium]
MARKQPPQQPPPVQRVRLRYAKRGNLRFSSSRDFSRAFERALRRASIPMAFSSGFSPHPRISYLNAVPTGMSSEAEFVDIGLAENREIPQIVDGLNSALPTGYRILAARELDGSPELPMEASKWLIATPGDVSAQIAELNAAQTWVVRREEKNRDVDVRPAILSLVPVEGGFELISKLEAPLVRPDDVLRALGVDPALASCKRLEQGAYVNGDVVSPL